MSLDPLELEVKRRVGTDDERRHAEKICPLISRHHRLLVTLLLFNSLANEALPIFLAELVPSYVAVLLSVTAILIFGEIIPSAMFTGPKQIVMASRLSGFVVLLMTLFYPITRPIAWVLDRWLGHNSFKRYTREELSTLVELQREAGVRSRRSAALHGPPGAGGSAAREKEIAEHVRPITVDEATIVAGVLKCHSKRICDAMKPMDEVYALCENDVLNENKLIEIMACGFSRIPVHSAKSRSDIRGFLLVKRLIILDPEDNRPIKTLPLRQPIVVSPTGSLLELINVFQEGRSHMAIVSPFPELTRQALRAGQPLEGRIAPIGIVTLEDLFEEILQEEIYDEHDARERKAIETLKKIRRKVKRQQQQLQQLQQQGPDGRAIVSLANGAVSSSNSSLASSPTLSSIASKEFSPATTPGRPSRSSSTSYPVNGNLNHHHHLDEEELRTHLLGSMSGSEQPSQQASPSSTSPTNSSASQSLLPKINPTVASVLSSASTGASKGKHRKKKNINNKNKHVNGGNGNGNGTPSYGSIGDSPAPPGSASSDPSFLPV